MRRRKENIDYQKLHSTGQRIPKQTGNPPQEVNNIEEVNHSEEFIRSEVEVVDSTEIFNSYREELVIEEQSAKSVSIANLSNLVENLSLKSPSKMEKDAAIKQLQIEQTVISTDIDDLINENDIDDMNRTDIETFTAKIEQLRTKFKTIHAELRLSLQYDEYEKFFLKTFDNTCSTIKNVMLQLKSRLKSLRREDELQQIQSKHLSITSQRFLVKEIFHSIKHLHHVFKKEPSNFNYDELVYAEKNLQNEINQLNIISKHVRELLSKEHANSEEVAEATSEYHELCNLKEVYVKSLEDEIKMKEISKEQKFQSSKLNIKLTKFKGYDSTMDIYSFQSDFEKLHIKSTPSTLLPDLLKNNYLDGPALTLVKGVDDIKEIWKRLKASYGDAKLLLSKKLSQLSSTNKMWRTRDPEKQIETISKILNLMRDIIKLATQHGIQQRLYYSDAIEKVYALVDDVRLTKWFGILEAKDLDEPAVWEEFIKFLEKELSIQQLKLLHCSSSESSSSKRPSPPQSHHTKPEDHNNKPPSNNDKCFICGEMGHIKTNGPKGSKLIQYFSCQQFVQMTPSQRFKVLQQKGLCIQCLFPGALQSRGKHQEGYCQHEFVCPHPSHDNFNIRKHVLLCQEHSTTPESQQVLQNYKDRCILRQSQLPSFSKEIKLSFHTSIQSTVTSKEVSVNTVEPAINNNAIYILQTIMVDNQKYTIFFDLGCSDMVISEKAVKKLGQRASLEFKGDITVGGVGQMKTISSGVYSICLPLHNGHEAQLSGVCLPQITSIFPVYQLKQVESDIIKAYRKNGGNPSDLPALPASVGGEIDIMLGIKYMRYHPKEVFQLESGLTIFQSMFQNVNGSLGVVGGPHRAFNKINDHHLTNQQMKSFFTSHQQLSQEQSFRSPDASLLHIKVDKDFQQNLMYNLPDDSTALVTRNQRLFEQAENTGSEITYRCVTCRDCKECKNGESIHSISLKEEVEQHLINKSVTVDIKKRVSIASLPLLHNPEVKLANNKHKALKVYYQQLKKLDKEPSDKADVISSERKLQEMGFVDYVENLTPQQQQMLNDSKIANFIPWRAVWKPNSISTPCRVVFDASQPTDTGYSLNDILAKGTNNMNRLVEILIRWTMHHTAFHTDVRKMYNSVKLHENHWCLQRYIWDDQLNKANIPKEKVIKTLIYGIKSSGNQSERALRETARLSKAEYPNVFDIITKDIYVDDCLSGNQSTTLADKDADELQIVVNRGGFSLKGVTFSHQKPKESLTTDGQSISVAGMKWYPEEDKLSLDVSELNFAKKVRGKKPTSSKSIPTNLTRRHCVSKVAELYDITGKITPITAAMKLDLHHLVDRGLSWDDSIPDDLRPIWQSHFSMMEEISTIKYRRAIVPTDAISLDIDTIDTGDASKDIACIAIYARFQRKSGNFSCQLVFGRSRLIPDGTTQPRAELIAATLNAHTGEVVRRSFQKHHKSSLKLTDNQIVLFWINGNDKQLKPWVRNRVAEIQRFTSVNSWKFVHSEDMVADIGTRKGATLADISEDSTWFNGFQWMTKPHNAFPTKTVDEIKLTNDEMKSFNKERIISTMDPSDLLPVDPPIQKPSTYLSSITERYRLSQYIVDPNKYGWARTIQIVGFIYQFISNSRKYSSKISLTSFDDKAKQYYFIKATEEIKAFTPEKKFSKISKMKDGILHYTGRILPTNDVTSAGKMTNVMLDLSASTFFVPLVDRYSPIAFSIVNHVHWYHPVAKHAGVETVYRYVLQIAYIIDGRDLIKLVRKRCERCRYLTKHTIEVEMGPISTHNLNIAPPFFSTQVDLCGPFNAYSNFHKRTTIKIWFIIFCCATTSATKIKVMDDYSTPSFILSFIRFASDVGYPKYLLPDEGSQLVKGCETIRLNFKDIKNQLYNDVKVQFEICPVSGHFMHGKVERKIQEIKKSITVNFEKQRLSVLQWETVASQISNTINDMPLALAGRTEFEIADVLTPNRLLMGRNNDRSPTFPVKVSSNPDKFMKLNQSIFSSWFEVWLTVHVPKLMHHPKWFTNDCDVQVGDIVLFAKRDDAFVNTYKYGKIKQVEESNDGRIRKVLVEYRNHNENVNRETYRAVRSIIMIHPVDELSLAEELAYANC